MSTKKILAGLAKKKLKAHKETKIDTSAQLIDPRVMAAAQAAQQEQHEEQAIRTEAAHATFGKLMLEIISDNQIKAGEIAVLRARLSRRKVKR